MGIEAFRRRLLKVGLGLAFGSAALPLIPLVRYFYVKSQVEKLQETRQWPRLRIANVGEMPPGFFLTFYYPSGDDPEYQSVVIHLPEDLARDAGREIVAYNRTCIHLRCLVNPIPMAKVLGCPCHGSIYRLTDAFPIGGPAKLIGRKLPEVELDIDEKGDIYAVGIVGEIGYGRS